MSWWGKVIGSSVGYAMGGTLGAIVGAVFGHQIDKQATDRESEADFSPGAQARVQTAFFTATFTVLGHISKADGRVSESEIAHARRVMDRLALPEYQRQTAMDLFARGKDVQFDLDAVVADLRREAGRRRHLLQMFMEFIAESAAIDGEVHAEELLRLKRIGRGLGFSAAEVQEMLAVAQSSARFESEAPESASASLQDAYAVLGVSEQASDDEVKKAYRRKMAQHHPDKLIAQGLPDEMVKMATRQTQTIRDAWERVQSARQR